MPERITSDPKSPVRHATISSWRLSRVVWAFQTTPTALAEFKLGAVAIAVALRLAMVQAELVPYEQRGTFAGAIPHGIWATVLSMWGVSTLYGAVWRRDRLRRWNAIIGGVMWSMLIVVATNFPTAPFIIVFFPLEALICLWVWLRRTGTLTG